MLRVSDCAGFSEDLRLAPSSMLPSASGNGVGTLNGLISQLNTGPTVSPVNASRVALRPPAHDSGARMAR